MELKKIPQADLENERTTFFLLGLVVAWATLFVLFEWRSENVLSPEWEGFAPLYIEPEFNGETLSAASSAVEPEAETPAPFSEEYHAVKETPPTAGETLVSNLLEQLSRVHETDAPAPETVATPDPDVYTHPDVTPQYPGGPAELARFLFNQVKYPASALSQQIQGTVWCSFVINHDGSIADIRVERGVYISLDQEAERALKAMPRWVPGTAGGKPVRVKSYLPIVFRL